MHRLALVVLLGTVLVAPQIRLAKAQAPTPAVPEVMPFDIPYGMSITLDDANKAIGAAIVEAKKHNWKMSVSVVDPSGNLLAHATMDGTMIASVAFSQAKARTAAQWRRPTKALADVANGASGTPSPSILSLLALVGGAASEGGWPIVKDGKLIGAIGASGGIATQDGVTAKAGLAALGVSPS